MKKGKIYLHKNKREIRVVLYINKSIGVWFFRTLVWIYNGQLVPAKGYWCRGNSELNHLVEL